MLIHLIRRWQNASTHVSVEALVVHGSRLQKLRTYYLGWNPFSNFSISITELNYLVLMLLISFVEVVEKLYLFSCNMNTIT